MNTFFRNVSRNLELTAGSEYKSPFFRCAFDIYEYPCFYLYPNLSFTLTNALGCEFKILNTAFVTAPEDMGYPYTTTPAPIHLAYYAPSNTTFVETFPAEALFEELNIPTAVFSRTVDISGELIQFYLKNITAETKQIKLNIRSQG